MTDVNLASRALGSAVVWANDEFFGMKENLVTDDPPTFRPHTFSLKGQIVDGWETRRRREASSSGTGTGTSTGTRTDAEYDSAILRLGAPGLIRGVTVDTSFFVGNFPPECSVEAADVRGFPSPRELLDADWTTIVARRKLEGDTRNFFAIDARSESGVVGGGAGGGTVAGLMTRRRFTHVRLNNIPDGGIARLRVHGRVLADPEFTVGVQCDLAAARNGGRIVASSNAFFSPATAALMPGESRVMGEGWETARRRDDGNDWIEVELVGEGIARIIEIDTANYVGNAPDRVTLRGRTGSGPWFELIPETRIQPDTLHRFRIEGASAACPATHLRLDTFPDGGVARLRVHGELTERGAAEVVRRWEASA
jgi:allantoicase